MSYDQAEVHIQTLKPPKDVPLRRADLKTLQNLNEGKFQGRYSLQIPKQIQFLAEDLESMAQLRADFYQAFKVLKEIREMQSPSNRILRKKYGGDF